MSIEDTKAITDIIDLYFRGTYVGDAEQLKRAFHKDAHITGILNNAYVDWRLADFIAMVTQRPTAQMKSEIYDKKILLIDITQDAAIVKAQVVVGPFIFIDYINLLKINKSWIIRHKSFMSSPKTV